jgi:hypothetical protein
MVMHGAGGRVGVPTRIRHLHQGWWLSGVAHPQPKEAQPLSQLDIRLIQHFDSSAPWSDGPEVARLGLPYSHFLILPPARGATAGASHQLSLDSLRSPWEQARLHAELVNAQSSEAALVDSADGETDAMYYQVSESPPFLN